MDNGVSAHRLTLNSPGLFDQVAREDWPATPEAMEAFLDFQRDDLREIVKSTLRTSPRGRTWVGLLHVMEQKGYLRVRELGIPAATVWAKHLGIVPHGTEMPLLPSAGSRSEHLD